MVLSRRDFEDEECMACGAPISVDQLAAASVQNLKLKLIACGPCVTEALRDMLTKNFETDYDVDTDSE